MAMPNIIQDNTAVNMSSNALANVFKMEFNDFKNNAVTIPIAALLKMMQATFTCSIEDMLAEVNASRKCPLTPRTRMLQKTESVYMKTF